MINSAIAISIVSIQTSHLFLLSNNPLCTSLYWIEANLLADWISLCHAKFDNIVPNFCSILRDLNLIDVCWATVTSLYDYSKKNLLQTEQINANLFVFEPTDKSGITSDVKFIFFSKLPNIFVDSHLFSNHCPVFAFLMLPPYLFRVSKQFNRKLSLVVFFLYPFQLPFVYVIQQVDGTTKVQFQRSVHERILSNEASNSDGCTQHVLRNQNHSLITVALFLVLPFDTLDQKTWSKNYRNGTNESLQQKVSLSVIIDKTVLFENLSPQFTHFFFKNFRSFSSNRLPNQKNRKNLETKNSNKVANFHNSYFSFVLQKSLDITFQPS